MQLILKLLTPTRSLLLQLNPGPQEWERSQGAVRRALSEGAAEEREAKRRTFVPLVLSGGKTIDVLLAEQDSSI